MAIIFDLDDTLFDHAVAMRAFLRAEFAFDAERVDRLLQIDRRGKAPRSELCDAVAAQRALDASTVWAVLQERFGRYATPIAPEIVEQAAARFAVALLTNGGSQNQRTKIDALGLDGLFAPERLLISAELGASKPDARAFEAALAALRCTADAAVYVGDDPAHDMAGARGAGLRTCWVARGRAFPDTPAPDWTIESIADLPSVWDQFPT